MKCFVSFPVSPPNKADFFFPTAWSDDDEVASNIDDYSAVDDAENYDEPFKLVPKFYISILKLEFTLCRSQKVLQKFSWTTNKTICLIKFKKFKESHFNNIFKYIYLEKERSQYTRIELFYHLPEKKDLFKYDV